MKKFIFTIMCLCITILMTSCVNTLRVVLHVLNPSVYPLVMNKKAKMERRFYRVVYGYRFHFDEIEELLKAGVDPNHCIGDVGWYDANPLFVMVAKPPPRSHWKESILLKDKYRYCGCYMNMERIFIIDPIYGIR